MSVLSVSGCVGIPLSSVYKMMTVNPVEFQPDAISVAIKRPKSIQIHTGDIEMNIFMNTGVPRVKQSQKYFFVIDNTPQALTLNDKLKSTEALTRLTLSSKDVIRMRNQQQEMKQHLERGGNSKDFGFSISVLEGCKTTLQVPEHIFISLFLKLDSRSNFFPLYQDFDIGQADLSPLKNVQNWDDCPQ